MKTTTGKRLLEVLQSLTPEQLALPVYTEGCDCTGAAVAIKVGKKDIEICRANRDGGIPGGPGYIGLMEI